MAESQTEEETEERGTGRVAGSESETEGHESLEDAQIESEILPEFQSGDEEGAFISD